MSGPRIGSLFSGYGGLEQGVQAVLGGHTVWHSEIDPGARKILAHRHPDVPNLGDITAVDWSQVEPVDVLTGGFPCQDVSCAGLREGLRPGTRSGLWTQFAYAIDQLRPGLVVIENVRGLLSAEAHSDLEPCPWCVGDGGGVPLRALGAVLGDLADIGYDASWQGLRAADVGAPHGRYRVFVTAWPANSASDAWWLGHRDGESATADADSLGHERGWRPRHGGSGPADGPVVAAHSEGVGREAQRFPLGAGAERSGPWGYPRTAADADRNGLGGQPRASTGRDAVRADQWSEPDGRRSDVAAHTESVRWGEGRTQPARLVRGSDDALGGATDVAWGPYGDAVRRWERLTRPAPAPTEPGKNGPRLSPAFVEWMQGLPAGWVTDVPGLSRNEQLKALGNGVVPQQAAQALRLLLPDVARAAA